MLQIYQGSRLYCDLFYMTMVGERLTCRLSNSQQDVDSSHDACTATSKYEE